MDLILPIVGAAFVSLPPDQQGVAQLQTCIAGGGRLGFWAPPQRHGLLAGLT
jgi:hypothetical protein